MLAAISSHSATRLTRALVNPSSFAVATISSRSMSITAIFNAKERVEEELHTTEHEKRFYEMKKNEFIAKMKQEESKRFQDVIVPAMAEIQSLISNTGDNVSEAGLEALARWKTTRFP